jgi:tetratricopeptide (TPR) repeat protein
MAERFLYLPFVGLAIAAAVVWGGMRNREHQWLAGGAALLISIVLCNSHNYLRRNDFTFFGNMARVEPDSVKARLNYGYALLQAGQKDDAVRQLEAGLRLLPDHPELLTVLAMTKMTSKDCSQGWPLLRRVLEIEPSHADAHRRMGDCYFKEGKKQEAEAMYRHAVESISFPDSMLYFMWGLTLEETGRTGAAVHAYERAQLIDPRNLFIQQKLDALRAATDAIP